MHSAPSRPITLAEVSQSLGVSPALVSLAFSGKGSLSARRRQEVADAARALGYEPNPLAQRLATGRAQNTVAFFTPDLDSGATIFRVQHFQRWFLPFGYTVQLHAKPSFDGGLESRLEILRVLRQEKPRALVCNAAWDFGDAELKEVRHFIAEGGEAILLSHSRPRGEICDQVVSNSQINYTRIVAHLMELGHRKIGVAGHDLESGDDSRREFCHALQEADLPVRDEWILNHAKIYLSEVGARAAQSFLDLKEKPTAVIVNADQAANAFLNVICRAGIAVPDQLSVAGIEDTPMSPYTIVPLSAALQPVEIHATRAAELLLQRLSGAYTGPPRTVWVEGDFTPRASTTAPRH